MEKTIILRTDEQVAGSELWLAAVQAYVELAQQDLVSKTQLPFYHDDKVVYAVDQEKDEIIGLLVYRETSWNREIWVVLGWVNEDYRRNGIYTRLYRWLQGRRDEKYPKHTIFGGTFTENFTMISTNKKLARDLVCMVFEDRPEQA